jgi:uncharacterized cupredoxin-like copper-binding protein
MKRFSTMFAVLLSLAFAMVACGAASPSTHLKVDLMEFTFNPANFTVPAGQEITLDLTNNGAVMHDFIIMKYGTTVGDDFGDEDVPNIYWEAETEPGTSATYTFTAPSQPGDYQVVCGVKGHYQAGMVAKLTVVAQ